jgi:hypothetical protein
VAVLLAASSALAAGSLEESREASAPPQRIQLSWTASTGGTVSVTSQAVRGEVQRVVFQSGEPCPTGATYAVTLKDAYGVDILDGQGAAVSTNAPGTATQLLPGVKLVTTAGTTNFFPGVLVNGTLQLGVTGVGTSAPTLGKQGSVILFVK